MDAFSNRASAHDGKRPRCKQCEHAADAEKRRLEPERFQAYAVKFYEKNRKRRIASATAWNRANQDHVTQKARQRRWVDDWMTALIQHAKGAARSRFREFTITREHVEALNRKQGGRCYWLGIPFAFDLEPRHPQRPSIDRIDPSRGYTPDNVVLACQFANMGRSILTAERFGSFLDMHSMGIDAPRNEGRCVSRDEAAQ